jgi:hypothetical protein
MIMYAFCQLILHFRMLFEKIIKSNKTGPNFFPWVF